MNNKQFLLPSRQKMHMIKLQLWERFMPWFPSVSGGGGGGGGGSEGGTLLNLLLALVAGIFQEPTHQKSQTQQLLESLSI